MLLSVLMLHLIAMLYCRVNAVPSWNSIMTFTPQSLLPYLPEITSGSSWYVGFSGGLDSTVLLHALCSLQLPVAIQALHVNHQISPHANTWQMQCEAFCQSLNIAFVVEKVIVKNSGRGIEDAARTARYAVFDKYLSANDVLLTAHHADDQTETLLLRLMRGTGPRGLAAMAKTRALGDGILHRPLLHFSRAELEAYAQLHQLAWVDDESNSDTHYDRNFLRAHIMPLLQSRWPQFKQKWQQTTELCAHNEELLAEIAVQDLAALELREARLGSSILLVEFLSLSKVRQQNVLRYWLRLKGFTIPEQQHWQQLYQQLDNPRADSEMDVSWGNVSLRSYQQRLYGLPLDFFTQRTSLQTTTFLLHECSRKILLPWGCLTLDLVGSHAGFHRIKNLPSELRVAYREGGERCRPAGRHHSQTLKRLLQEYGVEPWLRDKIPLVYCGDELIAVGDLWVCAEFAAAPDEAGVRLTWQL